MNEVVIKIADLSADEVEQFKIEAYDQLVKYVAYLGKLEAERTKLYEITNTQKTLNRLGLFSTKQLLNYIYELVKFRILYKYCRRSGRFKLPQESKNIDDVIPMPLQYHIVNPYPPMEYYFGD